MDRNTEPEAVSRQEAFRWGARAMGQAGVPEPARDAAVLIGHVTGEEPSRAMLERNLLLGTEEAAYFRRLVGRRCFREPLSQLLGSREFRSLQFKVSPDVLTPRPETETLTDLAEEYLKDLGAPALIVDVGTGSGAVAISLAVAVPSCRVVGIDISQEALRIAGFNARRNGVEKRVYFARMDLTSSLRQTSRFDLIVSNPPYVREDEYGYLPPEVRIGDPRCALVAGPEGTEFYGPLALGARCLLKAEGMLMVEVGKGMEDRVSQILENCGYSSIASTPDLAGINRVVTGRPVRG